jgi:hypothetical protein
MKTTIVLIIGILSINGIAQTKQIAHKSHSGTAESFTMDGPDNFGIVIRILSDSLIKLNDSTAVEKRYFTFGETQMQDTLHSSIFSNLTIQRRDSINNRREVPVTFVGFDSVIQSKSIKGKKQQTNIIINPSFPDASNVIVLIAMLLIGIGLFKYLPKEAF